MAACRTLEQEQPGLTAVLYPNPAHQSVQVKITTSQQESILVRLTDLAGRLIREEQVQAEVGENYQEINLEGLTPGMYMVGLYGNQSGQSVKTLVVE